MAHGPIVLVGGATAWPHSYRGLADVLREVSGSEVYTARLTPLDWLRGYFWGYGQLVFEVANAVDRALLEHPSQEAILLGHSAGGLACRIYLGGDPPYGGRRYSGHRRVSHVITLGSPHVVHDSIAALAPVHRINELFPGAMHEKIGYLSVAGNAVDGKSDARARRHYAWFAKDARVPGDGVVPIESALLPGAEHLILDGLYHNHHQGRWYGSDRETVARWCPQELRAEPHPELAGGSGG